MRSGIRELGPGVGSRLARDQPFTTLLSTIHMAPILIAKRLASPPMRESPSPNLGLFYIFGHAERRSSPIVRVCAKYSPQTWKWTVPHSCIVSTPKPAEPIMKYSDVDARLLELQETRRLFLHSLKDNPRIPRSLGFEFLGIDFFQLTMCAGAPVF